MAHCDFCGEERPVTEVIFRRNTGMVFVRETSTDEGNACRRCAAACFWRSTLHNLVLGWWGVISLFVTPIFLLLNLVNVLRVLRLPAHTVTPQPVEPEPRGTTPVAHRTMGRFSGPDRTSRQETR